MQVEKIDRIRAWSHGIAFEPGVVVRPESVEDVVSVAMDSASFPSPVRASGSMHSVVPCGDPDRGTLVDMRRMNRIIDIGRDFVIAEAGALYIDVAKALEKQSLQFFVNVEIGNVTMGAAACAGTKDSSLPDELGQVSSYAKAMKVVIATGEVLDVDEEKDPDLMRALRCSYGLLGVVCEVTFRVKPLEQIAVSHRNMSLDRFVQEFPSLTKRSSSMFLYIFPFLNAVTVESVRYARSSRPTNPFVWNLRNFNFRIGAGGFARLNKWLVPFKPFRHMLQNLLCRFLQFALRYLVRSSHTMPAAQMVRYPKHGGFGEITFSFWAFPVDGYVDVLRAYFSFCRQYDRNHGYRGDVLTVGYLVSQDTSSIFSYSSEGPVATIDPVSTGGLEWKRFLDAYNEFCIEHGGIPLFNQTPGLTNNQVRRAFGDRLEQFEAVRNRLDPGRRFLNAFFKQLFAIDVPG